MSTIPSPVVTGSIGALEIGTIVMTFFFGIGTVQTFHYYRGYPHDSLWLKSFIAVVWLCELGHTISVAWGTYTVTVTRFGDLSGVTLDPLPLGFAWSILFSGLLGPLVQGFFAHRVHVFSKKIYIPLVCWAASLLRLSGSLVAVVKAVKQPSLQSYGESNGWLIMLLLVVGAFVDITVAASLCYFLGRERPFAIGRTVRMLDQLMAYTIETGLVTSLTAVTILVCLKTMPNNLSWFSIYLFFGEVFANTLMASLNSRRVHPSIDDTVISLSSNYVYSLDAPNSPHQPGHIRQPSKLDYIDSQLDGESAYPDVDIASSIDPTGFDATKRSHATHPQDL